MQSDLNAGRRLPDIVLPSLAGDHVNLADLRGKRRLLYMWGSWWMSDSILPARLAMTRTSRTKEIVRT